MLGDQRHQVRDGPVGLTRGQQRDQPVPGHGQALLGEPGPHRFQPGVRNPVVRRPPPAAQRVVGGRSTSAGSVTVVAAAGTSTCESTASRGTTSR